MDFPVSQSGPSMEDPLELNTISAEMGFEEDPVKFLPLMDEKDLKPIKIEQSTDTSPDHSHQNADAYMVQEHEIFLKEEQIEEVLSIKHEEDVLMTQHEVIIKLEPKLNDDDVIQSEYNNIEVVKEEYDMLYSPDSSAPDSVVRKCQVVVTRLTEKEIQQWLTSSEKGTTLKPYKCQLCKYRCRSMSGLEVHIRSHTGEKPYACDQCDYRAGIRTHLANHKRLHTGERPFECKFCGYRAYQLGNLLEHERIHSDVRPFKCEYCSYRATRKRHLAGHMKIHRENNLAKCKYCDFRAVSKRSLTNHVRTHTGEPPLKCDYCNYQCIQKGSLYMHTSRWHAGPLREKPYKKCNDCGYRCFKESDMKAHLYGHTGVTPFSCYHCRFKTSYKPSLAKHIQVYHINPSSTIEEPCKVELSEDGYGEQAQPLKSAKAKRWRQSFLVTKGGLFICSSCQFTTSYKPSLAKHLRKFHDDPNFKAVEKVRNIEESEEEYEVVTQPQNPVKQGLRKRAVLKQPWWFSDFIMSEPEDDTISAPRFASSNDDKIDKPCVRELSGEVDEN